MNRFPAWIGYSSNLEPKEKFTYIINGFCIGLVLLFLPFYAFYVRSLPVSLATILCLIILLIALPLLKHRRFTTAKIVMMIGFFYQVSALALFWFPREANFNYFYYIVAPIVFFILDFRLRTERRMIIFSCALAMLLLIFSEVSDIPEPVIRLSPGMIDIFSTMSVISTIGSMSLVFYFYASNLAEVHGELNLLAMTDSLTGAYNRRTLDTEGRSLYSRTLSGGGSFCLLILDIDRFKTVNDTWGHPVGDIVLKELSDLLSAGIRKGDLLFRHGGEEFAIILKDAHEEDGLKVAEQLRASVENHGFRLPENSQKSITISIGTVALSDRFETFESMMEAADAALYRAKQAGRNRVEA